MALIRVLAVVGVLFVVATSANATTREMSSPRLGSMLLSVKEMPSGWSVDSSIRGSGLGCLSSLMEPKGIDQTATATIHFDVKGGPPEVSERLATYSGLGRVAFTKIVAKLDSCRHFSGVADGEEYSASVGQMAFSRYGDQSAAFTSDLNVEGTTLGEDIIIVRKKSVLIGLSESDFGSPDVRQFQGFVSEAFAKVS
jgi:hypothetical protein